MPTRTRGQRSHGNTSLEDTSEELPMTNNVDVYEDPEDVEELQEESPFPPPGLKEISSLASWTVSTAKPGNGVTALRSPDMSQFWQSDGPQPHLLNIHFFKLVPIVLIRVFLDFENDESYTPTKIQFLAGMGAHDLQEFAEMEFEQPTGWIEVDFGNVGPSEEPGELDNNEDEIDWSVRPVLRAMLLQVRILENHQNGKDTHLRGVQIFAKDESQQTRRGSTRSTMLNDLPAKTHVSHRLLHSNIIKLASWMQEPDLR